MNVVYPVYMGFAGVIYRLWSSLIQQWLSPKKKFQNPIVVLSLRPDVSAGSSRL